MKRKLNGLLSLWLAVIMILPSFAVAATETTCDIYLYEGSDFIEENKTYKT